VVVDVRTAVDRRPEAAPAVRRSTLRSRPTPWIGLVAVFAGVFLVLAWGRITAPFGDSHDGRNAAVWASGSRALRTEGPLASRLGARVGVGPGTTSVYVDHPPLTYWETAVSEELLGVHPWSTRAPAWAGTIAAAGLLFALLRRCGVSGRSAAVGTALGLGCPMIGVYGAMLDSWVVGLPWAIASLLVWQRRRVGHPCRTWITVVVTAGTMLSCWPGVLLTAMLVGADVVRGQGWRRLDADARARIFTAAASAALVLSWMVWTAGSLTGVWSAFASRAGAGHDAIGVGVAWASLRSAWSDLLTPWELLMALPAVLAALVSHRTRPVAAASLGTVVVWTVLFRNGAAIHDYWSLWLVVPVAVGSAVVVGRAEVWAGRHGIAGVAPPVGVALVGLGCLGLAQLSVAQIRIDDGRLPAALLRGTTYPEGQSTAWYVGDLVQPVDWISYLTQRPARQLVTAQAVLQLASTAPNQVVFAGGDKLLHAGGAGPACSVSVPGPPASIWTANGLAGLLRQRGC
jgi:hypothetical protein